MDIQMKIKELLQAGMLYGGNTPEEKLTWLIGELETLSRVELPVGMPKPNTTCEWKYKNRLVAEYDGMYNGWETGCGKTVSQLTITSVYDFKFCPFCLKDLHEQP